MLLSQAPMISHFTHRDKANCWNPSAQRSIHLGGGHSQYILVGVCRSTSKKGGLRHGHNPKKGGLRHGGTTPKRGVLGTGTSRKGRVLGTGTSRKRRVLRTGLVKKTILVTDVAQKGVLGAYLLITLTFLFSTWSIGGGLLLQTKNRGLRHGSGQKRGVLGTGQARKRGVLGTGQVKKGGVFTAAHTCTGHICECPPPPPGAYTLM